MTPPAALARAPVPSLGLVLAGCPDCRAVLGIDGAPGLPAALATHRRGCPAAGEVCGGCGCEAKLYSRGDGWRCADCLGERLVGELAGSASQPANGREPAIDQEEQAHHDSPCAEGARLYPSPGRFAALVDHPAHQEHQAKRDLDCTQPQVKPSHPAKPARSEAAGQIGRDAA